MSTLKRRKSFTLWLITHNSGIAHILVPLIQLLTQPDQLRLVHRLERFAVPVCQMVSVVHTLDSFINPCYNILRRGAPKGGLVCLRPIGPDAVVSAHRHPELQKTPRGLHRPTRELPNDFGTIGVTVDLPFIVNIADPISVKVLPNKPSSQQDSREGHEDFLGALNLVVDRCVFGGAQDPATVDTTHPLAVSVPFEADVLCEFVKPWIPLFEKLGDFPLDFAAPRQLEFLFAGPEQEREEDIFSFRPF